MGQFGIVGGGQGGLITAIGLLQNGHDVTLFSDRSPEEIRSGRVTSNQTLFHPSLEIERELGIHFWEDQTHKMDGFHVYIAGEDDPLFLDCKLHHTASSVDQRLKFARWMKWFERQGGRLILDEVKEEDLPELTQNHDLIVVSTGKGELGQMFDKDHSRSTFDRPQRNLVLLYLRGLDTDVFKDDKVNVMIVPGRGEMFATPVVTTTTGLAFGMVIEAIPGGPFDQFQDIDFQDHPEQAVETATRLIQEHMPIFADGVSQDNVRLTDHLGVLTGGYPPTVREGYIELPNDTMGIGIGDAVVLNDPIVGQGANNATEHAWSLLEAIENHQGDYDLPFARQFSEHHWNQYAQYATRFSNSFLTPPDDHIQKLFGLISQDHRLGYLLAQGFADPTRLDPWYFKPESMENLVAGLGYE